MNYAESDHLRAIAKTHGFDAFIPAGPEAAADPERYSVGATCFCRGRDNPPVAMPLDAGETRMCPLCGATFHLFEDRSGIGIRHSTRRSAN